jgi:proline racemase/trans-L-3-hydroxyproline dehydratase
MAIPRPSRVSTVDYHTGGEPFRIVTDGVPDIPGTDVLSRRAHAQTHEEVDAVRRLLCHEPRGHADMYGCFLLPADPSPDGPADLAVLFWHKDGYSTACGHGTIALGAWAVNSGRVAAAVDGETEVSIDVPSGRVIARVRRERGVVRAVTFRNVPSWVAARGLRVPTTRGEVAVDVAYGGAFYAALPASAVGLAVTPDHYAELIAIGREIKWAVNGHATARHPVDERLSGIYGTILFDDLGDLASGPHQRNVTVFADGEVDRSPCGSGTAARVALLADEGRLAAGAVLTHDSIVGSRFTAVVADSGADSGADAGRPTVVPEITGTAHRTGEHTFTLEADDDLGLGFVLR